MNRENKPTLRRLILSLLMMSSVVLWPISARAEETIPIIGSNCPSVLGKCVVAENLCKLALDARTREVDSAKDGLGQAQAMLVTVTRQRDDAQAALQSWYRNPATMATIGVLLGLVVGGYALRK